MAWASLLSDTCNWNWLWGVFFGDVMQEYVPPQPSRRPDIFPEFEPLETPTPTRPPGDPELPDEFVRKFRLLDMHVASKF